MVRRGFRVLDLLEFNVILHRFLNNGGKKEISD